MKNIPHFTMGVAPFPQDFCKAVVIAGTNIGMFRQITEEQKRLAWEFIRWFLKPENQMHWTEASYYLPTRKSTTEIPAFRKFLDENPGYDKIVEQLDFAKTEPMVKEWFTGRIYLNEAREEAVRLERRPQEALDYAAQRLAIETD